MTNDCIDGTLLVRSGVRFSRLLGHLRLQIVRCAAYHVITAHAAYSKKNFPRPKMNRPALHRSSGSRIVTAV